MPLLRRKEFQKATVPDLLRDDEEVFYCDITKEIFRNYEEYFERVMLINSMVWSCALTGRPNLTYQEALNSEKEARRTLLAFPKALKAPIILVASQTKRSSLLDAMDDVYNFIKDRYFKGEEVICVTKENFEEHCIIVGVKDLDGKNDPTTIQYCVRPMEDNESIEWFTNSDQIKRIKSKFSKEKLKLFIKQHIEQSGGVFKIKDESYKKITLDCSIKFEDIYTGTPPSFEISKRLLQSSATKNKKQISISKYLTKDKPGKEKNKNNETKKANNKNLKEEMERRSKELAAKEAEKQELIAKEKERQKLQLLNDIQTGIRYYNKIQDDLELHDQRVMPVPKPIELLIPRKYFGDFLMVLEFMNSFASLINTRSSFPQGVTFQLLQRALLVKEVAGPLSDILQTLLVAIFTLQFEEEREVKIQGIRVLKSMLSTENPLEKASYYATKAIKYSIKYFGNKLGELPIDATTVSEVLRLHFLSSGAKLEEKGTKWRFQQRGGYNNVDDPGLYLRLNSPHIIRALSNYSVYELPIGDIFKILKCLISQIMTYSSVRDLIEDRLEDASKSKILAKSIIAGKRKRESQAEARRKELKEKAEIAKKELQGTPEDLLKLHSEIDAKLQDDLQKVDIENSKAEKNYIVELNKAKRNYFDYQIYLGSDRAHRNYWLFESLPGLFVEHDDQHTGKCLDIVSKQIPELVNCTPDQRNKVIKQMIIDNIKASNKENNIANNVKPNGILTSSKTEVVTNTPEELLMCTADVNNCPVHTVSHPKRISWSFFHTEEEINDLIVSLNTRGIREKILRENLESEKELILNHISDCPVRKLQVDLDSKDKILSEYLIQQKKYLNSNFAMNDDKINDILAISSMNFILEFEQKILNGYLGSLKVKDPQKWRNNLSILEPNTQSNGIKWGPEKNLENGICSDNEEEDIELDINFEDPGINLGNTVEIESEDSSEENIPLHESPKQKQIVQLLATALLQVEQSIDAKFLKWPYGFNKVLKDKTLVESKVRKARNNLKMWEVSLMNATSFSQICLHYNLLHDAIQWSQSVSFAACKICKRKGDPEKMLICDGCNRGHHMYCLKPQLRKVPEGDWFCNKCQPVIVETKRKRKIFVESETSETEVEEDESNNEENDTDESDSETSVGEIFSKENNSFEKCSRCNKKTNVLVIQCSDCDRFIHRDCIKPPPRKTGKEIIWKCVSCAAKSKIILKRQKDEDDYNELEENEQEEEEEEEEYDDDEDDDDDDDDEESEPIPKKRRRTENSISIRSSTRRSKRLIGNGDWSSSDEAPLKKVAGSDDEEHYRRRSKRKEEQNQRKVEEEKNSRRSRRANENLPLDNVSLYVLLDDIARHSDSWPFNRPVAKLEVPDYYDIIRTPMDFAKIKSKLNRGEYVSNYSIMHDIELVFRNCDLYNTSESEIYHAGVRLEKFVMKRCKVLNLPFKPSDMVYADEETTKKISE